MTLAPRNIDGLATVGGCDDFRGAASHAAGVSTMSKTHGLGMQTEAQITDSPATNRAGGSSPVVKPVYHRQIT